MYLTVKKIKEWKISFYYFATIIPKNGGNCNVHGNPVL